VLNFELDVEAVSACQRQPVERRYLVDVVVYADCSCLYQHFLHLEPFLLTFWQTLSAKSDDSQFKAKHLILKEPQFQPNTRSNQNFTPERCNPNDVSRNTCYPGPHSTLEDFGLSTTVAWKTSLKERFFVPVASRLLPVHTFLSLPGLAATHCFRVNRWAY